MNQKETIFCHAFCRVGDPKEAAVCVVIPPDKAAAAGEKMLASKRVRDFLKAHGLDPEAEDFDIRCGLKRLAFGNIDDCVRLVMCGADEEEIRRMNLFSIAEIRRTKDGLELKLFDRLKALAQLDTMTRRDREDSASAFFEALDQAGEESHV